MLGDIVFVVLSVILYIGLLLAFSEAIWRVFTGFAEYMTELRDEVTEFVTGRQARAEMRDWNIARLERELGIGPAADEQAEARQREADGLLWPQMPERSREDELDAVRREAYREGYTAGLAAGAERHAVQIARLRTENHELARLLTGDHHSAPALINVDQMFDRPLTYHVADRWAPHHAASGFARRLVEDGIISRQQARRARE